MAKLQFRILFSEFLFRMVDLELLSAHALGDIGKLLGQFATLLLAFSASQGISGMFFTGRWMPPDRLMVVLWAEQHSFIATTMLVAGLFGVLCWDSAFLNRRDVLVLAPLPVRTRTLFLAKVAALATALGVNVGAVNAFQSFTWAFHFAPASSGLLGLIRSFAAYWITMAASGAFILCSVLGVQGLAAQLPRRYFLRLSAVLQIAAFCLFICVYFIEPPLATPQALTAAQNQQMLTWLPSYWFLGLYQALNGSMHPAMLPLAHRAWIGLAVAVFGAGAAFLLSYFRTLPRIVEEPDIVPGGLGRGWLPRFGSPLETAVVRFSIRTLFRSRQHRLILAFYLGIGFAVLAFVSKTGRGPSYHEPGVPLMLASVIMMFACIIGARVVFGMPLELRANWIFRITQVHPAVEYLAASRRPLFVLAVAPVWLACAAVCLSMWPWQPAAIHLGVLGLGGVAAAYLCLYGFQKVPFTCSYLPGKSQVHFAIIGTLPLFTLTVEGVVFEWRALSRLADWAAILAGLAVAALCVRWRTVSLANSEESVLLFEEEQPPVIQGLGLYRDGTLPLGPACN